MTNDATLARILDLVIRDRHLARNHVIFVSAPPGSGKTESVLMVATTAARCGLRVGIACPRAWQSFDLMRRMLAAYPEQGIRLWVGSDRPIPGDLSARAHRRAADEYAFGPGDGVPIDVATVAKYTFLTDARAPQFDLLIVDEAFQVTLAELTPLLLMADRFLLVGDPGQLPPLVRIDVEPFTAGRFRVHDAAAAELLRHLPNAPHLEFGLSHRLPHDTVSLIQPALYPTFRFCASAAPTDRRLVMARPPCAQDAVDRALDTLLEAGSSLVCLQLPGRSTTAGPVDPNLTAMMATVVERMLERGLGPVAGPAFGPQDIGCIDPHVASGAALRRELRRRGMPVEELMVETPEVWQGHQRPMTVTAIPYLGGDTLSPFDLELGRIAVSLSRHQYACVIVARAGIEHALKRFVHDSGARPLGADDALWQGVLAYHRLWHRLRQEGRLLDA